MLSHSNGGQQVDVKAQQCHQTVSKIRVGRKHNLFHTAEQVDDHSTQEAMVLGRCMGDIARRHSTELVFCTTTHFRKRTAQMWKTRQEGHH